MTALEFLKKSSSGGYRIVSFGDLNPLQIETAKSHGEFFVDDESGLGWAMLPWELNTRKDIERDERIYGDYSLRAKAMRFIESDYDPRLDPNKTPFFERMYWRVVLWWRG